MAWLVRDETGQADAILLRLGRHPAPRMALKRLAYSRWDNAMEVLAAMGRQAGADRFDELARRETPALAVGPAARDLAEVLAGKLGVAVQVHPSVADRRAPGVIPVFDGEKLTLMSPHAAWAHWKKALAE